MNTTPRSQFSDSQAALTFLTAGKAIVTLHSLKSGARFTYKVDTKEGKPAFVSLLTGPDNESDYRYLGCIFEGGKFVVTKKSCATPNAPSALAFGYVYGKLVKGEQLPAQVEVWHEGCCGRCGRTLTVPESIACGLGPECREKMGL